jgi:hypothetical protein
MTGQDIMTCGILVNIYTGLLTASSVLERNLALDVWKIHTEVVVKEGSVFSRVMSRLRKPTDVVAADDSGIWSEEFAQMDFCNTRFVDPLESDENNNDKLTKIQNSDSDEDGINEERSPDKDSRSPLVAEKLGFFENRIMDELSVRD